MFIYGASKAAKGRAKRLDEMRRKCFRAVMAMVLILISVSGSTISGQTIVNLEVRAGEYDILDMKEGMLINMEGFGYLMTPGKPMLPEKRFIIGLPPGAKVRSVEVSARDSIELSGIYRIMPSPPIMPVQDYPNSLLSKKLLQEWRTNKEAIYSNDQAYPDCRGKLTGAGTLRKYSYVSVSFNPFSYYPKSGRLVLCDEAWISVSCEIPSPDNPEMQLFSQLQWDSLADEQASRLLINYQQIKDLYQPKGRRPAKNQEQYNYVIITAGSLLDAILGSDFLDWKASLGYNVRIAYVDDSRIANQSGRDLAEQIRNFLRENYGIWGIEYVLIVGDYATIPMRYCFPDSANHSFYPYDPFNYGGEVPTDYYYADLSGEDAVSWDFDGDGFYGEYGQDLPDFLADVYVGRIPTNDTARITYVLNKLVAFEQDTGAWKNRALHAGAILFFENQDYSDYPKVDGAKILDFIEADLMDGWTISRYSEREGLDPSEYLWPPLSLGAFNDDWRQGEYGIVNWAGHGSAIGASRSIWFYDDGDGVPESAELSMPNFINIASNLDDDHPSIVFAISCLVGYPEPNAYGRLGVDLLTGPSFGSAAGIVSATRGAAVAAYTDSIHGGAGQICYEFNHFMICGPDGPEKVGKALYDSKFYCNQSYPFDHYYEYKNMFDFNLYGDPSLAREGIVWFMCGDANSDETVNVSDVVHIINYIFAGGQPPYPIESGDVNCDYTCNISDAIWIINYIFAEGNEPCDTDGNKVPDC